MGKLELKHLAPYLPYGLRYSFNNHTYWKITPSDPVSPKYDLGTLIRLGYTSPLSDKLVRPVWVKWDDEKNGLAAGFDYDNDNFKPILRPLSDLAKSDLLQAGFTSHIDYLTNELQNPDNFNRLDSNGKRIWRVEKAPYEMVEFLFKYHFDVFGLIPGGLAISYKEAGS